MTDAKQAALNEVEAKAQAAKNAARPLVALGTAAKNAALLAMADALSANKAEILDANKRDVVAAQEAGSLPHFVDRLTLNDRRIGAMQDGLRQVAALPDPVGRVVSGWRRPNGLQITRLRVPLGVVGIIYESRPNVTVDAAALCLKAGNAVVLRGGSEAIESNKALVRVISHASQKHGVPAGAISLVETTDRAAAQHLMTLNRHLDMLIPRGGASLIQYVVENATVPVIETGTGNCHVYVDDSANPRMAESIVLNAKTSRPSVCNAAETLLVHRDYADRPEFLELLTALVEAGVELRCCPRSLAHADTIALGIYRAKAALGRMLGVETGLSPDALEEFPMKAATDEDYFTEFSALVMAVKVVNSIDEAISHIAHYGTRHSEAIVTQNYDCAQQFTDEVDAAAVYVNASTRFTDGYEFGFGAEIGISNQKLHARGPMGLEELTTTKYVVRGDGQVR